MHCEDRGNILNKKNVQTKNCPYRLSIVAKLVFSLPDVSHKWNAASSIRRRTLLIILSRSYWLANFFSIYILLSIHLLPLLHITVSSLCFIACLGFDVSLLSLLLLLLHISEICKNSLFTQIYQKLAKAVFLIWTIHWITIISHLGDRQRSNRYKRHKPSLQIILFKSSGQSLKRSISTSLTLLTMRLANV